MLGQQYSLPQTYVPFDSIEFSGLDFGVTVLPDTVHQQDLALNFLLLLIALDFSVLRMCSL